MSKVEEILKAQDVILNNGGFVSLPNEVEKEIYERDMLIATEAEREEEKRKQIQKDTFMPISIDWITDNPELAMDSIVPACCKHECHVEPDGVCEHGNESVLLYHGLI